MNLHEFISSGILETYVLGTAAEQDIALVNDMCKKHPEVLIEIQAIENSLIHYAAQHNKSINSSIKAQLETKLFTEQKKSEPDIKVISLPKNNQSVVWLYKLGIAASFLIAGFSVFYIVTQKSIINNTKNELTVAITNNITLNLELKQKQDSLALVTERFLFITNPKTKTIALNGMNSLINKNALIHWNTATDEVYFNALALPKSNAAKQYQLWAIIDGKPVDAGVIDLNDVVTFQKMKSIHGAQAFAVTIENTGGSLTPSLTTMCFLGNV